MFVLPAILAILAVFSNGELLANQGMNKSARFTHSFKASVWSGEEVCQAGCYGAMGCSENNFYLQIVVLQY
jgi:hypothetical protein